MRESWKQALLENLRQRGIVDEAAAAAVMQQSPAPWFVHLFAGLAAWLAALMLILSSALALAHDSLFGAILIGAMLLGLAVWLLRQPGIFLAQMGLALSLAGQGMLVATPSLAEELTGRGFRNIRLWSRGVDTELFHPRRRGERPCECHPLSLPTREGVHAALPVPRQTDECEHLRHTPLPLSPRLPEQSVAHVAGHILVHEELPILKHQPEAALVHGLPRHGLAVPQHVSARQRLQPGNGPQQ